MVSNCIIEACLITALVYLCGVHCDKYKICVVDGKGSFKKSARYCPVLKGPDSKVECIIGTDRLDCLRKISKGIADFSMFTPEDLIVAANSEIEVLLTNMLRYSKDPNEYEVVAVISNDSGIKSRHDLKDKKLCHPGYGYETDWTRILANYLEASVVPKSCQTNLTLTENRIKASSDFFKSACKSGPWVNNEELDRQLKKKYWNLCALCDRPEECNANDKYGGRQGSLYCLTDGAGDISWARLDNAKIHFGLHSKISATSPEGYSFLCPDDTTMPVNSSNPCVWVVKPWPVIAAKRTSAQDVQQILSHLSRSDSNSWQYALLALVETFYATITDLDPIEAIESYFSRATGFLSANSFSGCHPPRTIRICTTSNVANTKCGWLRETAAVYGIEPDLDCIKAENTTQCMQAINERAVDIVMVPPDLVYTAKNDYNLTTLFYETVNDDKKYITVAVVRNHSQINRLEDLKNKKACFPVYNGIAYNSVKHYLHTKKLIKTCPFDNGLAEFFGPSCVPRSPKEIPSNLKEICRNPTTDGDLEALDCLISGKGDVAFISRNSFTVYIDDSKKKNVDINEKDFKYLCEKESNMCHLSWAPVGQAMVRNSEIDLWLKDTLDVFLQIDILFGKQYKSITTPYTLYGDFNSQSNVLFSDFTVKLRNVPVAKNTDKMPNEYESIISSISKCEISFGSRKTSSLFVVGVLLIISIILS